MDTPSHTGLYKCIITCTYMYKYCEEGTAALWVGWQEDKLLCLDHENQQTEVLREVHVHV